MVRETVHSERAELTTLYMTKYRFVLGGGFALLFLILVAGESLIIFFGSGVQEDIQHAQEKYLKSVQVFGQIQTNINLLRVYIRDEVFSIRTDRTKTNKKLINNVVVKINQMIREFEPLLSGNNEKENYQGFVEAFGKYHSTLLEIVSHSEKGEREIAQKLLVEKLGVQRVFLESKAQLLIKENEQIATSLERDVSKLQSQFIWIGILILASSFIIGTFIYLYMSRSFQKYVHNITTAQQERESLMNLVQVRQGRIEELMLDLETSIENERKRFAHDLHDAIGHGLTTAIFNIDAAVKAGHTEVSGDSKYLMNAVSSIKDALVETKRISYELRPPVLDDFGLAKALEQFAIDFEARTEIQVTTEFSPHYPRLNSRIEISLYRIVQEALTNVEKHSGARHVTLQSLYRNDGTVALSIYDDGQGFDPLGAPKLEGHHLGIKHITERISLIGGTVLIESSPGKGTEINIEVPSTIMEA